MINVACTVPVSAIRAEPSHQSEQVSQLLFGEVAEKLVTTKDFIRVKASYDDYEGWCQASQLTELNEGQNKLGESLVEDWTSVIMLNRLPMHIPFGSSLGLFYNGLAAFGSFTFEYAGKAWHFSAEMNRNEQVKALATRFLNTPYQWGGRSVFGVDCSGFSQTVFRYLGIRLMRDAYQQASQGEPIGFLQESKCGDLAFLTMQKGKITHVGVLLNAETIIHASGKVRIDAIDNMGIINTDTGARTHRLRIIKRMICETG